MSSGIKTLAQKLGTGSELEDQQYSQLQENSKNGRILDLHPRPIESESELFHHHQMIHQFSSVQSLSRVQLFVTPRTAKLQASLSITNSQSLPKLMSFESVMPSNNLILYCPLLLPTSIFSNIRVFSNESALCMRWLKYWSFSFNISPSNEYSGLISFRMDWLDLLAVQGTFKRLLQHHSSQNHQLFSAQFSLQSNSHIHT